MKDLLQHYNSTDARIAVFESAAGITEYHILFQQTDPDEDFETQLNALHAAYTACMTQLTDAPKAVFKRYFLSDVSNQTADVMEKERLYGYTPLSIVQQAPLNGTKLALWVWLQSDVETGVISDKLFEARAGRYRQLFGTNLHNRAANSEYQMRLIFREYIMQLAAAGCNLAANCLRTWIFVQNVDVNYAGVVKARKEIFATQNLTEHTHYIASTGIEGRHVDPMVFVTMDTYAVDGIKNEQIRYLHAPEHLNRTYEYGVTFERGTAITYGDRSHIFISGTASIDKFGEIVYPGDIIRQAGRMMENIEALLAEAGAGLSDIMQAIVYLRDTADYKRVKEWLEKHHPALPFLLVLAPVCRPGWLIETECIAVKHETRPEFAPFTAK